MVSEKNWKIAQDLATRATERCFAEMKLVQDLNAASQDSPMDLLATEVEMVGMVTVSFLAMMALKVEALTGQELNQIETGIICGVMSFNIPQSSDLLKAIKVAKGVNRALADMAVDIKARAKEKKPDAEGKR